MSFVVIPHHGARIPTASTEEALLTRRAAMHSIPALAVVLLRCQSPASPRTATDVTATVAVTPAQVAVGDTAHVVVDVVNHAAGPVTLLAPACNAAFVLRSAGGTSFRPAEQELCMAISVGPLSLPAGESLRFEGFTTGLGIVDGSADPPTALPPGTYQVHCAVVRLLGDEDSEPISDTPALLQIVAAAP